MGDLVLIIDLVLWVNFEVGFVLACFMYVGFGNYVFFGYLDLFLLSGLGIRRERGC